MFLVVLNNGLVICPEFRYHFVSKDDAHVCMEIRGLRRDEYKVLPVVTAQDLAVCPSAPQAPPRGLQGIKGRLPNGACPPMNRY